MTTELELPNRPMRNSAEFGTLNDELDVKYNIAYSDLTVICGENVRTNTVAAFEKALTMRPDFERALIINTSTRQHWALKEARKLDAELIGDDPNHHPIMVIRASSGDLWKHISSIREKIERYDIRLLIINSWEFSSCDSRYRDKLLFALESLIEELGVTVVMYTDKTNVTSKDVGKTTRGALGKLSAIAAKIIHLQYEQVLLKCNAANKLEEFEIEGQTLPVQEFTTVEQEPQFDQPIPYSYSQEKAPLAFVSEAASSRIRHREFATAA